MRFLFVEEVTFSVVNLSIKELSTVDGTRILCRGTETSSRVFQLFIIQSIARARVCVPNVLMRLDSVYATTYYKSTPTIPSFVVAAFCISNETESAW